MSVKAGDFFVSLGIKGADKTNADLKKTQESFKDLKEGAMEAKVAFLAVFAVLSKIVLTSTGLAQTLKNLSTVYGISTKAYQEVALAGRPYGVETSTSQGYLTKLSQEFVGMKAGEDGPAYALAMFAQLKKHGVAFNVGVDYYSKHPEEYLKLQEKFLRLKGISPEESSFIMSKQGMPVEMMAAAHAGAYENLSRFDKDVLSDKQLEDSTKASEKRKEITAKAGIIFDNLVANMFSTTQNKDASKSLHKAENKFGEALRHPFGLFKEDSKSHAAQLHNQARAIVIHYRADKTFHITPEQLKMVKNYDKEDYSSLIALMHSADRDR